jgi:ABC-2 type transport system ATP-binding protein
MLTTLLKPTSGHAEVAGYDVVRDRDSVRNSIGIVFQETALDNRLTGFENLEFHSVMYSMGKEERRSRIGEVLEIVELTDKADTLVEKYSGGMKRRLEIARGLIHRPKVLFLDEPSLGLDTQTRRHIWEYISRLNREKVTVVLTTHYMDEADSLSDRISIIDHGRIIASGTSWELKNALGQDMIYLATGDDAKTAALLRSLPNVKDIRPGFRGLSVLITTDGTKCLPAI